VGRAFLQGRGQPISTIESEGQMLQRACGELLALKNVVVINDEAHHCYREKPNADDEGDLKGEEKDEAKKNNEAARLWISGIEALKRKVGVRAVYDLSATPFFLRGSGYAEATLFPWTVSDFSLMDAIECGIVKLPRIPVVDNAIASDDVMPKFRNMWEHIGPSLPRKGAAKSGDLNPMNLPALLQTALFALYDHYIKVDRVWREAGIRVPPVFIVVCSNTAVSKLVYEWIAGWERTKEDGERHLEHWGNLELFRNYDRHGVRFVRPNTLLIDSAQLESGEALDKDFRTMAGPEIEQFKREMLSRGASKQEVEHISDADLLREVMNTVGKEGRLGADIRCVVSVSMLTEGWDTNTVTHIVGVRAFGTQLLCEQVVGRALRRQSYDLNEEGLFDVEYADILGIPFNFTAAPVVAPTKKPKKVTRVQAVKAREALAISFPRVTGYRKDLADEQVTAEFSPDSRLVITPDDVGPGKTLLEGIVGEGVTIGPEDRPDMRESTISFTLAKRLLYTRFAKAGEPAPMHLFYSLQRVVRRWLDGGYLDCQGGTRKWMVATYQEVADRACELIDLACQRAMGKDKGVRAILDPYNPRGSTTHVQFNTTKELLWDTARGGKCHINYVVGDSTWELELARVVEAHPRVLSYVKNQGLQFTVPYRDGGNPKKYLPDFIVQVEDGRGRDDPLNVVVETKGYRGLDAQLKAETMAAQWVPGVNNLGTFGRWAFAEFRDLYEIEKAFAKLVEEASRADGKRSGKAA
jgi:type III restriction enzyme